MHSEGAGRHEYVETAPASSVTLTEYVKEQFPDGGTTGLPQAASARSRIQSFFMGVLLGAVEIDRAGIFHAA
jgi:hypothetical protein